MNLPVEYINEMKKLLGEAEFEDYLRSFEDSRSYGLRVNNLKISTQDFFKLSPFKLTPIPWIDNGFFYDEAEKPAKHPYYFAGLYYLQEPSAMTPANLLPISKGDTVLDMCAAPGGKSTELAAKLNNTGLLVSNDISASRAKALLKNIELFGAKNIMVINEETGKLAGLFPEYFDKVLIDAPCSGEGMFRKDNKLIKAWEKNGPQFYGRIQRDIILNGADMLKPGGYMMYSTCTFSTYEDEETIQFLLDNRPEMKVVAASDYEGFSHGFMGFDDSIRIFPHRMQGEGHFLTLLRKDASDDSIYYRSANLQPCRLPDELKDFLARLLMDIDEKYIQMVDTRAYLMPPINGDYQKLRKLRAGLLLGEVQKGRFEPSQALAMALKINEFNNCLNLAADDIRTVKYLKGETIDVDCDDAAAAAAAGLNAGWVLVCVDGFPLGWGKLTGTTLKNKYHAGWRWQ